MGRENRIRKKQKKLLECLDKCGIYFIPFSLDGNWDYAESIKVIEITELIRNLQKNSQWTFDIASADIEFRVYMLEIYIYDEAVKKHLLDQFNKDRKPSDYLKIKNHITLYLRYSDICSIQKAGICAS